LRAAVLASAALVAGCGSGAVGAPPATPVTTQIAVTPSNATLFSDLPTTFQISGGNGSYVVTSSNQAVIALSGTATSGTLTVVPSAVTADTAVTLTIADTGGNTPTSASLTVKPRTISNVVTITPSASQSEACGSAVCSGGDAEVKIVMAQGGAPLVGKAVRIDVVSGDVRVITSPAGSQETLSLSGTTTTDSSGTARMRIRVLADAASQTAILRVSDLSSGFTQDASVTIAPSSNAPLTVQPTEIQFTGLTSNTCAGSSVSADVIIVGGRPPYQITQPSGFLVSPQILTNSGGRVTITATGQCTNSGLLDPGQIMSVVDNNGATVPVTIHNRPAPVTPQTAEFAVAPATVTLQSCRDSANVALVGGTEFYSAASGNSAVLASVVASENMGVIRRNPEVPNTLTTVIVTFTDGQKTKDVTVTLTGGAAAGPCPP
jgi:hypothetical protein